jgi:HEAT repeat protein
VLVRDGRITIQADKRSLGSLLRSIARRASLSISVAPELEAERVVIALSDVPLDEGLRRLLRGYDAFFFYAGSQTAPELAAVWVFPEGRGRGLAPANVEAAASDADIEARLTNPDPETRIRAIAGLIERRGADALSAVLTALSDEDDQVRIRALQLAFGEGLDVPAERLFDLALNDRSPNVRLQALQTAPDRPELAVVAESAQHDPDPNVQNEARAILARLGGGNTTSPDANRPQP